MKKNHNSWFDIILDFFESSVSKSSLYKSRTYINAKKGELNDNVDSKKYQSLIKAIDRRESQLKQERIDAPQTEVNEWLEDIANKNIAVGKRIIKVTHTGKFTHSSANNDGLIVNNAEASNLYLCSESMHDLSYDLAHNNGNLVTVSRFLALSKNGKMIIDCILENNFEFLENFYHNKEQLEQWTLGLSEIVEARNIASCDKLKSLYFPIDNTYSNYHLLCPLYATSLSQKIFDDYTASKYSKKRNTFSDLKNTRVSYIDMAYINFGGEHAKNVSMLNANRGGKGYLFSCQPPIWTSQDNQYTQQERIFDKGIIRYRAQESLEYLTDYVTRFQDLELSVAKDDRRKWIERWTKEALEVMTQYADEIIFQNDAGWSVNVDNKFKQPYKLWLDPYNPDETFQNSRNQTDWQSVISQDFARWLANVISYIADNKNKNFTYDEWYKSLFIKLANDTLREHEKQLEMLRFNSTKEESV